MDDLSNSVSLEMDEIRSNHSKGMSQTWPVLIDLKLQYHSVQCKILTCCADQAQRRVRDCACNTMQ